MNSQGCDKANHELCYRSGDLESDLSQDSSNLQRGYRLMALRGIAFLSLKRSSQGSPAILLSQIVLLQSISYHAVRQVCYSGRLIASAMFCSRCRVPLDGNWSS